MQLKWNVLTISRTPTDVWVLEEFFHFLLICWSVKIVQSSRLRELVATLISHHLHQKNFNGRNCFRGPFGNISAIPIVNLFKHENPQMCAKYQLFALQYLKICPRSSSVGYPTMVQLDFLDKFSNLFPFMVILKFFKQWNRGFLY